MKVKTIILGAFAGTATAYPGLQGLMTDLAKRQGPPNVPAPLIGDLKTQGATTAVGKQVLACIQGTGPCELTTPKTYKPPSFLGSFACRADTCCVWHYVAQDLVDMFTDCDGTCNKLARAAVRFGFHDAAAWDQSSTFGGADGSLFTNNEEINRKENNGLQAWQFEGKKLLLKYGLFGVGSADLAQFAHNVATVVCPLGPRTHTYVGRKDSSKANTPGLLPDAFDGAEKLIKLFSDKTTTFVDLVSLLGAHTAARQFFVDASKAGQPLDSSPGVWDVKFYQEVVAGKPPAGVFRLPSDDNLRANNRSGPGFAAFANPVTGQTLWNSLYSKAYVRMSLFGVNNINQLTDCTKVLPSAQTTFSGKAGLTDPVCQNKPWWKDLFGRDVSSIPQ